MKKIAVLGFGVIGSGVCRLLTEQPELLKSSVGESVELKYICDLRDIPGNPYGQMHIKDFDIVCGDPEISVVVEVTGARRAAYELSKKAMEAGKSVVTSNKEVVAEFGPELLQIAAENKVSYLFEAAVGGAIPLISTLRGSLASDDITEICGILNGTTNYILTQMKKSGTSYADALDQAQRLGYAEPDPAADVEGTDTCRKTSVLSAFISGELIPPSSIPTTGITGVKKEYLELADGLDGKIKLIGCVKKADGGIYAATMPCFVPSDNALYGVDGVNNGILVRCKNAGDLMFYGRGAGAIPTAAAILSDISRAVFPECDKNNLVWHRGAPVKADRGAVFAVVRKQTRGLDGFMPVSSVSGDMYDAYILKNSDGIDRIRDSVVAIYDVID